MRALNYRKKEILKYSEFIKIFSPCAELFFFLHIKLFYRRFYDRCRRGSLKLPFLVPSNQSLKTKFSRQARIANQVDCFDNIPAKCVFCDSFVLDSNYHFLRSTFFTLPDAVKQILEMPTEISRTNLHIIKEKQCVMSRNF